MTSLNKPLPCLYLPKLLLLDTLGVVIGTVVEVVVEVVVVEVVVVDVLVVEVVVVEVVVVEVVVVEVVVVGDHLPVNEFCASMNYFYIFSTTVCSGYYW
jgi:hypothetical protein